MSRHRRLWRICRVLQTDWPYVVQGDADTPQTWVDVASFRTLAEADRYLVDVTRRQEELLDHPGRPGTWTPTRPDTTKPIR